MVTAHRSGTDVLLRRVELAGAPVDVRLRNGLVAEIVPQPAGLRPVPGETVLDGAGGALLPGLVDHHLHLLATTHWESSVDCSPRAVRDAAGLAAALRAASPGPGGWVRGVGYHESVAGPLDRDTLDGLRADVAVRIAHRSGALWMVNGVGVRALRLDHTGAAIELPGIERDPAGRPTGRLWRLDTWLRDRWGAGIDIDRADPGAAAQPLARVGALLARYGITEVTDATPDLDQSTVETIAAARRSGMLPQRVRLLGASAAAPGVTLGPVKIVLSEHALPSLAELTERITVAHTAGRAVAVHAVTAESLLLLLAALDEAGGRDGDRVEHASLVPAEVMARLRPLRVVTQPGFIADRGDDYLSGVARREQPDLYPTASLRAAGVRLALSSDAPHGPLDPWAVIRAARDRTTPAGATLSPGERLPAGVALRAYLAGSADPGGPPRDVAVGAPADLCLLRVPLRAALAEPHADLVACTIIAGRVVS